MGQEEALQILNGELDSIGFDNFVQYKSIASIIEHESIVYLVFIQICSRKVFIFAPNSENDHVQNKFLNNWK